MRHEAKGPHVYSNQRNTKCDWSRIDLCLKNWDFGFSWSIETFWNQIHWRTLYRSFIEKSEPAAVIAGFQFTKNQHVRQLYNLAMENWNLNLFT